VAPPGVLYLFGDPFSFRARRWRTDAWVRVSLPAAGAMLESRVHFVRADELTPELVDAVLGMALAAGIGDTEAVEVFLRVSEPGDLAVVGAQVVWRMAAALGQLIIRLEVDPALPGGLAIYGRRFGRYPLDPTVVLVSKP